MREFSIWLACGALTALAIFQQFHIYRVRRAGRKRGELFRSILENTADMIALVDARGQRLYNNSAYKRILGYSAAELSETWSFQQIHPDDRFHVLEAAREARESGIGRRLEYRIRHKNGSWRSIESIAHAIRDENGTVARLVIVNRDITERRHTEERREQYCFHDPLTGLPNRNFFLERLQHFFQQARREPEFKYAALLVGLDHFNAWSRSRGAAEGDRLLVEAAKSFRNCLDGDGAEPSPQKIHIRDAILARLAEDEFAILLDDVADPSDALRLARHLQFHLQRTLAAFFLSAEKIKQETAEEKQTGEEPATIPKEERKDPRLSVSIGIALHARSHRQAEELLQEAEVALRRAQALGGSRCEVFDEAMHNRAVRRLELEDELRAALDQHQFCVYYQPIVHLESRRIAGFEALLRWRHPRQGLISPYKFLEAAEDIGLLAAIGHRLLQEVCAQLRRWQELEPSPGAIYVSVNMSARQFAGPGLIADLQAALQENAIAPSRLQLEITERVAAADPRHTAAVLSQLKQLGIGRTLDNFGSGNFSLNGLRHLAVDGIKIDRALVGEIFSDRSASDIVEAILGLARKMNLRVVAEGIESVKQMERLREFGCELGQGYLFSPPVEAEGAQQLLAKMRLQANSAAAP